MEKILVSWIGANDLKAYKDRKKNNATPGPLLAALKHFFFTGTRLIYNYPPADVKPYLTWIQTQAETKISANYVRLKSPVDFSEIHDVANQHLEKTWQDHPNADVSIHLSPGTPVMMAIWVLLGKTRYPCQFIQSSIEEGVKSVDIPFDIAAEFLPSVV